MMLMNYKLTLTIITRIDNRIYIMIMYDVCCVSVHSLYDLRYVSVPHSTFSLSIHGDVYRISYVISIFILHTFRKNTLYA